jgi:hypothetical protein
MEPTRQQRRQRERDLIKQGELARARGLPRTPPKSTVVGLGLIFRDVLTDKKLPNRASRAAGIMHQVFEASLAAVPPTIKIACAKGCSYCCHSWVGATAPELFLIARHLRDPASAKASPHLAPDAVIDRAAATAGIDISGRFGAKLPCVFLTGGACSIYAVRPTVCRQTTSTLLAPCVEEFDGKDFGGEIAVSQSYLDHARNCRIPLQAALMAAGLPSATYELSAALVRALEPDAEARWIAGAPVFAGVAEAPPDPAALQQAVHTIAAELA